MSDDAAILRALRESGRLAPQPEAAAVRRRMQRRLVARDLALWLGSLWRAIAALLLPLMRLRSGSQDQNQGGLKWKR